MSDAAEILETAASILIVDWPSRDVPDTLVRAGYVVYVKNGPGPQDYSVQELRDGEVVARKTGQRPERIDLVYVHRPQSELPGLVARAKELRAHAIWRQSGKADADTNDPKGCWLPAEDSLQARELAESAGMRYVDEVYIADVARSRLPAQ